MGNTYVVQGATLKCDCGSKETKLSVPNDHKSYISGKAQGNVEDYLPFSNIKPFGGCSRRSKKRPCLLLISAPWMGGKRDVLIGDFPALLKSATLRCNLGGTIRIKNDGQ
jgi:hypothetical protein